MINTHTLVHRKVFRGYCYCYKSTLDRVFVQVVALLAV